MCIRDSSSAFAVAAAVAFAGAAIFVFGIGPLKQVEWGLVD